MPNYSLIFKIMNWFPTICWIWPVRCLILFWVSLWTRSFFMYFNPFPLLLLLIFICAKFGQWEFIQVGFWVFFTWSWWFSYFLDKITYILVSAHEFSASDMESVITSRALIPFNGQWNLETIVWPLGFLGYWVDHSF